MGDIRCANITILDDTVPQGERNFSISIGDGGDGGGGGGDGGGGGGGVRVDPNLPSIEIKIELDVDDSKFNTIDTTVATMLTFFFLPCSHLCWLVQSDV